MVNHPHRNKRRPVANDDKPDKLSFAGAPMDPALAPGELDLCPFCGSANVDAARTMPEQPEWAVACTHCGAIGPAHDEKDQAKQAWNRRARRPVYSRPRVVLK